MSEVFICPFKSTKPVGLPNIPFSFKCPAKEDTTMGDGESGGKIKLNCPLNMSNKCAFVIIAEKLSNKQ